MSEIIPNLFVGTARDSRNKTFMEKNCIKCVLNVAEECRKTNLVPQEDYMQIKLSDVPSEKIDLHFQQAIGFISKCLLEDKPILVHCFAGISRSATMVIAFLMFLGCDYKTARQTVQEARPIIFPNSGFVKSLKKSEHSLMSAKTVADIQPPQNEEYAHTLFWQMNNDGRHH